MKRAGLGVVIAGVLLAGVSTWRVRTNQTQDYHRQLSEATLWAPAPRFLALDSQNELFRLERYLGRHRILVVFFDARLTAARDPQIQQVRNAWPQLNTANVKVVGISSGLPQEHRESLRILGDLGFPLVSDVDLSIHRRWGRCSSDDGRPMSGSFLIDRKGDVAMAGGFPEPIPDLPGFLKALTHRD